MHLYYICICNNNIIFVCSGGGGGGGGNDQYEDASEDGMDEDIAAAFDQFMIESEAERASFHLQQPGFDHYSGGHHHQQQQQQQQQYASTNPYTQNQYNPYPNQAYQYRGQHHQGGRGNTPASAYTQYARLNQHRSGQEGQGGRGPYQNQDQYSSNPYHYNNGYQQQ